MSLSNSSYPQNTGTACVMVWREGMEINPIPPIRLCRTCLEGDAKPINMGLRFLFI
ncbi:MAG: hypothetical protein ACK5L5_08000 [Bacteroidales bacterium]